MKSLFKLLAIVFAVALFAGNAMAEEDQTVFECLQAYGVDQDSDHKAMVEGIKACGGLSTFNFLQMGRMITLLQKETLDTIIYEQNQMKECMQDQGFSSLKDLLFSKGEAEQAMAECRSVICPEFKAAHNADIASLMQCLAVSQGQTTLTDAMRVANACIKEANAQD
ncbi:MAG: hypothetical protein HKP58_08535 [Desulfatitalea sp.]|nr:hypothetical protein [Desulfatitalea sp.]NNK00446.1 hypothetical protein [Desulfatitalea sp.]